MQTLAEELQKVPNAFVHVERWSQTNKEDADQIRGGGGGGLSGWGGC